MIAVYCLRVKHYATGAQGSDRGLTWKSREQGRSELQGNRFWRLLAVNHTTHDEIQNPKTEAAPYIKSLMRHTEDFVLYSVEPFKNKF